MSEQNRKLSVNVFTNLLGTMFLKGITFFLMPITTKLMTPADFGYNAIFIAWSTIITIFASLQIHGTITAYRFKLKPNKYKKYLSSSFMLGVYMHVILFVAFIILSKPLATFLQLNRSLIPLLLLSSYGYYVHGFLNSLLILEQQVRLNTVLNIGLSLSSVGLSIFLSYRVFTENRYYAFILGSIIPYMIIAIPASIYIVRIGRTLWHTSYAKMGLAMSLPLIFHSFAGLILSQSDRVMLQKMRSIEEVGIYSFIYQCVSILSIIDSAIIAVFSPLNYKLYKNKDFEQLTYHMKNYNEIFVGCCIGFILVYPEVIRFLANEKYWKNFSMIPVLMIAFLFDHLYKYPVNYEFYCERTKWIAAGSIGVAAINILANFLLIPRLGVLGAAIATAVAYGMLLCFHDFIARRKLSGFNISKKIYGWPLLLAFSGTLIYYIFQDFWLVRWIIAIVIGIYLIISMYKRKTIL